MKTKCFCGKKANRHCPALNSPICSLCCGTKRHESINCPKDCLNNPLNPELYLSHYLPIEDRVQAKLINLLDDWFSSNKLIKLMNNYIGPVSSDVDEGDDYNRDAEFFIGRLFNIERNDRGQTFRDYLELCCYKGFIGIEKIIAEGFVDSFGGIFEFTEISGNGKILGEDLLTSEKFVVMDKSMEESLNLYDRVMLMYFKLPTYTRITGVSCISVPRPVDKEFLKHVEKSFQKASRKTKGLTIGKYILEEYLDLGQALIELVEDWQDRALSNLDFKECKAEFRIRTNKEEIITLLEKKDDFLFDEETADSILYDWVRRGQSKKYEKNHPVYFKAEGNDDAAGSLGTLILKDDRLILINFAKSKYDFCRKMLSRYFGSKIEFLEEIIVDQNELFKSGERFTVTDDYFPEPEDEEEIPQEIKIQLMETFYKEQYKKFLNDQIPALSYKTPLQAAKDKKMRYALIELMK